MPESPAPAHTRIERDTMGEVVLPADALYGAQTQRAVENFPISGDPLPSELIRALGLIKLAAVRVNRDLGLLDEDLAAAIEVSARAVADGELDKQFPIDIFQTGSGTSSNMNANEVIAAVASSQLGRSVHPNDEVNLGQSSNDVIPTALHVSAVLAIENTLLPALHELHNILRRKSDEFDEVVKIGRTHLMDA
ncbi:MAG: aspartate ammonia-lyase, partial [Chloroflexia bacterium]|nr:aspartate ammonia-lyase [Chloroflexia bacterium]